MSVKTKVEFIKPSNFPTAVGHKVTMPFLTISKTSAVAFSKRMEALGFKEKYAVRFALVEDKLYLTLVNDTKDSFCINKGGNINNKGLVQYIRNHFNLSADKTYRLEVATKPHIYNSFKLYEIRKP